MKIYDKITPEGTKDILFAQCEALRAAENRLASFFRTRGYREVMTPGLEFYDVFYSNAAYFPQESMYKLTDGKGRLLVMRPDNTIPIARLTATRLSAAPRPLRLFYDQPVFRHHTSMRGASDELRQMGVELLGAGSLKADIEILDSALRCLRLCGIADFRLEICPIGFFKHLIDLLDCDVETRETIRELIESKNYAGLADALEPFGGEAAAALKKLPRLFGGEDVIAEAEALCGDETTRAIFARLRAIYEQLAALGWGGHVLIDMGLVNQAEYYTGIIFRAYAEGVGEALLSGGRYDRLLADFGEPMEAVGFGINLDLVARAVDTVADAPPVCLVHAEEGCLGAAYLEMDRIITGGHRAELSVFDDIEAALDYCRAAQIPKLCVVGATTRNIMVEKI